MVVSRDVNSRKKFPRRIKKFPGRDSEVDINVAGTSNQSRLHVRVTDCTPKCTQTIKQKFCLNVPLTKSMNLCVPDESTISFLQHDLTEEGTGLSDVNDDCVVARLSSQWQCLALAVTRHMATAVHIASVDGHGAMALVTLIDKCIVMLINVCANSLLVSWLATI